MFIVAVCFLLPYIHLRCSILLLSKYACSSMHLLLCRLSGFSNWWSLSSSHFAVSPESSVTITPNTSNNFQGDTQTFACSAIGGSGNMFSWRRLYDNTIVGNTSNLTVNVSGATDGGQYRCEVSNLAGSGFDTATLNGDHFMHVVFCK